MNSNSSSKSTNQKEILKKFVKIFFDFLEFVKKYSNKNSEFLSFYRKSFLLKKTNIRLFIKMWYEHICSLYFKPIMEGNVDFFLHKDYKTEINKGNNTIIIDCIKHMKELYTKLEKDIVNVFVVYMQKLTYLSALYYKN